MHEKSIFNHQRLKEADILFEKGMKLARQNQLNEYFNLFETIAIVYFEYKKWKKYIECQIKIMTCFQNNNQLKAAEDMAKDSLSLYYKEIGEASFLEYRLLSNLARIFSIQKEHRKSKEYYQKGLLIATKLQRYDAVAHSYTGIGNICADVYKYHEALSYYYKAVKIEKLHGYDDTVNHKVTYLNIASIYFLLKQYELSKNYFHKALFLFEKGNEVYYTCISSTKNALGKIANDEGFYVQAEMYYKESLQIKQKYNLKDTDYALLLFRRGLLYVKQKDWLKGEEAFREAISLQNTLDFKNYEWFFFAYKSLAALYMEDKQWHKAFHYLEKAKKANQNLPLTKNYGEADIYFHLAILFEKQNKLEQALQYTQKAVKYWDKGWRLHGIKEKKLLLKIRNLQINIYRQLFNRQKKVRYLYAANQLLSGIYILIEDIGNKVFQEKDRIHFNQQTGEMYNNVLYLLYEHYLLTLEEDTLEEIFVLFEKSKVNSLLSSFKNAEALQLTDIPSEKLQQLQKLQSNIVFAEKKVKSVMKNVAGDFQNETAEALVELQIDYHQSIQKLEEEYPNYMYTKGQLPSMDVEELQQLLKPQTALIEYEITKEYLYIFCLSSTDIQVKRQPLSTDFDQQLNYLIDDGILGLNRKKYVQAAYQVYQLLIEPILPFLQKQNIKHLHIIPDNQLLELPFEALLTAPISYKSSYGACSYLIRDYSIQYHYSATLWAYQQKRAKKTPQHQAEFMGFAPVYSYGQVEDLPTTVEATRAVNIEGVNYQALLYSEKEVQDIQASFTAIGKPSQIHLRTDANLQHFKKSLSESSAKYLHIAAHSVLSEEEEELVGILFSPVQAAASKTSNRNAAFVKRTASGSDVDTSDMVLYPNEVAQLSLESDLVFLSCCKSGVGKMVEGEGMLSINRSFLSAGVSNIVFTLFKIYDSKTPILTQHFYEAILQQGKSYSEALQYAKLQMIASGAAPKFWSGFLLLGE